VLGSANEPGEGAGAGAGAAVVVELGLTGLGALGGGLGGLVGLGALGGLVGLGALGGLVGLGAGGGLGAAGATLRHVQGVCHCGGSFAWIPGAQSCRHTATASSLAKHVAVESQHTGLLMQLCV